MAQAIKIAVLANASQAKKELTGVAGTAEGIGSKFSKLRLPAMAALGGIALGAKQAIGAASDLNEETSKSGVIFGQQAGEINRWAGTASTSFGQSKRAALEAAGTFGLIGQKAGLSGGETAKFSKQFTTLASDMASFSNTSPEEAVTAIGAAMRGESEPIRKYGVMLDDATLKNRALQMGLIKNTKEALTPQNKALAASKEIWAQTGKAHGDFARTADGAANKQRTLTAQTEDLKAKLGNSLLPAYQQILGVMSEFTAKLNPGVITALVVAVGALAVVTLVASAATTIYNAAATIHGAITKIQERNTARAAAGQWALNAAMLANPVTLIIIALIALAALFVILWMKSEKFRAIVIGAWNAIKAASAAVWGAIKAALVAVWNAIKTALTAAWNAMKTAVSAAWNAIKTATTAVWNGIKTAIKAVVTAVVFVIRTYFNIYKTIITTAWNVIKTATTAIWNGIKTAVTTAVTALMTVVRGIKDKVISVFSGAASWLKNAGQNIIDGLLGPLRAGVEKVKGILSGITSKIPDWKGPPGKDKKLLFGAGQLIIGGLVSGIDKGAPQVQAALAGVTKDIAAFKPAAGALEVTAADAYATGTASNMTINLRLTADQVSALQRGRAIEADRAVYLNAGGRPRA